VSAERDADTVAHPISAAGNRRAKILRFLATGLLNTAFGYMLYALFLLCRLPPLWALLWATAIGVVFNYFSFRRVVFGGRVSAGVFLKFVVTYVAIYGVNAALLSGLTRYFALSPYAGQVLCIPVSVLLSWVLMNHWVYKKD
jgi:putative flippase GtrA